MLVTCRTCLSEDRDAIEASGRLVLDGQSSWRELSRQTGIPHQSLKNHMEKHFVSEVAIEVGEVYATDVAQSIRELRQAMTVAPPEVKPFYLVAIRNLEGIAETKPSQEHLLKALKGIHEVTGMRMEQRMLMAFAAEHFKEPVELALTNETLPVLVEVTSEAV